VNFALIFITRSDILTKECYWFVLKTKVSNEKKIYKMLLDDKYEVFLPMIETIRQWSDRKKKVSVPLIPSTVFVNCQKKELNRFYNYTGVVSILKYLNEPAIVKEFEIQNLIILEKEFNGIEIQVSTEKFEIGQQVQVVQGPFKNLIGESIKHNGKHRLMVKVEMLNAEYIVNIPRSFVRAYKN
jgi:transcriptional antiterminator NusG